MLQAIHDSAARFPAFVRQKRLLRYHVQQPAGRMDLRGACRLDATLQLSVAGDDDDMLSGSRSTLDLRDDRIVSRRVGAHDRDATRGEQLGRFGISIR